MRNWLAYQAESRSGNHYREMFRETGLLATGRQDFASLFEKASEHVSPKIFGEIIPSVGEGLEAESRGYAEVATINHVRSAFRLRCFL